jgi:hypothetical protein
MRKTSLLCGLASGMIASSLFIALMLLGKAGEDHFDNGAIFGYTLMILAFSFIFVGTKITRDKYGNGSISFGKAFRVGLYISLIASTIYVIVWLIDYHFFIPDFAEKYAAQAVRTLKDSGASEAKVAAKSAEMAKFTEMYKNPVIVILMTYMEILPVGLLASLICAWVLKRKRS